MSSTNQSPEYQHAEKMFLRAQSDEERLPCLEEMIRFVPKHKSAEAMRANLKMRLKKLQEKLASKKKTKKGASSRNVVKKEGLQAVLIGLTNSGKSRILASLTNAHTESSPVQFNTKFPILGTLDYNHVKIQIVDLPAIESEYFDSGIANTADVLLVVITSVDELKQINPLLERTSGDRLIILNKIDLLSENERRKLESRLKSNKLDYVIFSAKTNENISELKEKLFLKFNKIRVYTKQPKKPSDLDPVILPKNSTVKNLADKIFHGLSDSITDTRITGPSSKFPNQQVSLSHVLKDKDVVEFHTK